MKLQNLKKELVFDKQSGKLICKKKLYTEKEVQAFLTKQRKICAIIPLLHLSRGRTDWREWNKWLRRMSDSIKHVPVISLEKQTSKKA